MYDVFCAQVFAQNTAQHCCITWCVKATECLSTCRSRNWIWKRVEHSQWAVQMKFCQRFDHEAMLKIHSERCAAARPKLDRRFWAISALSSFYLSDMQWAGKLLIFWLTSLSWLQLPWSPHLMITNKVIVISLLYGLATACMLSNSCNSDGECKHAINACTVCMSSVLRQVSSVSTL